MNDITKSPPRTIPPAPVTQTPPPPQSQPAPGKRRWFWLIAVLILVVSAIVGLLLFKPKSQPAAPSKAEIPLLRYGTTDGPINTFYPDIELEVAPAELNKQIFEGLVAYEGRTKIVPLLATGWSNEDETTWIFDLKPDVEFHNGRTMTAEDVKYSLTELKESVFGEVFGHTIKDVEVLEPLKVKITTDGPDPILLNRLTFLFIVDSQAEQPGPENGTGPYQLKPGTTPSEQRLELAAFPDYHGGQVYTRELRVDFYDNTEALQDDLRTGKLDLGGPFLDQTKIDAVTGRTDLKTFVSNTLYISHIGINHNKPDSPLSKLSVRQALHMATDIPALLKATGQLGEPASQIVTQDIPGYNPSIKRPARDVTKARQLLAEAGYPDGVTLELTYFSPRGDATATELARQLAEAGIVLRLDPQTDTSVLGEKALGGGADLYLSSYATDVLDAIDVFATQFTDNPNYRSDTVEQLIAQANGTFDNKKRLEILEQTSKVLMDDVAWLPLFTPTETWVVKPDYVLERDILGSALGIYFKNVYQEAR